METSPFPSSALFPASFIHRDIAITGRLQQASPEALTAAAVAGGGSSSLFHINCNYLSDRFTLAANRTIKISNLVLDNCRTFSTLGFFVKQSGAVVYLNNVVDNQGR